MRRLRLYLTSRLLHGVGSGEAVSLIIEQLERLFKLRKDLVRLKMLRIKWLLGL